MVRNPRLVLVLLLLWASIVIFVTFRTGQLFVLGFLGLGALFVLPFREDAWIRSKPFWIAFVTGAGAVLVAMAVVLLMTTP